MDATVEISIPEIIEAAAAAVTAVRRAATVAFDNRQDDLCRRLNLLAWEIEEDIGELRGRR